MWPNEWWARLRSPVLVFKNINSNPPRYRLIYCCGDCLSKASTHANHAGAIRLFCKKTIRFYNESYLVQQLLHVPGLQWHLKKFNCQVAKRLQRQDSAGGRIAFLVALAH